MAHAPHEPAKASYTVTHCQVCGDSRLETIAFLGYLPPVNTMPPIGAPLDEQPAFPTRLLRCERCELVQLGTVVDAEVLFPPSYPYTSGTTRILRDNFAQLCEEVSAEYPPAAGDLCVDIGSNDGTLLKPFAKRGYRVRGIEPTNAAQLAIDAGVPTLVSFFDREAVAQVLAADGPARLVTAANCFAHIDDPNGVVDNVCRLLADDGLFVSESHYLASLVETLQYDTIYHEHMRYYSLQSLKNLLGRHGLEVIHARRIPTHGGSIRVYAARPGRHPVRDSVAEMLAAERGVLSRENLARFQADVTATKLELHELLAGIKRQGKRIHGIGAPSRASTLINYTGLDHGVLDCVLEIQGSHKIGKYIPGTLIPVLEESRLYDEQPEYALLLSWHIAEELIPKIEQQGFRGDFIVPLPRPRIIPGRVAGGDTREAARAATADARAAAAGAMQLSNVVHRPQVVHRKVDKVSPWVELVEKHIEFAPDRPPAVYHSVGLSEYVAILALTEDGRIPLVRQYRPAVERYTLELPAGLLEPGESPEQCCHREIREETGLRPLSTLALGCHYADTGRLSNRQHAFFMRTTDPDAGFRPEPGMAVEFVAPATLREYVLTQQFSLQLHLGVLAAAMLRSGAVGDDRLQAALSGLFEAARVAPGSAA